MKVVLPCAIYTRKSSEEGLEQGFNSLDAQREACEAYILSQKEQGWKALPATYDDGGFSGGNTERPGLRRLMEDIAAKRVKIVVVYKVDRLTRSLADFAKMVELFDAHGVSFVSVTQQFNTTSSMGRLTLNVLLSFAQFEREVTGERIRDKIAASKKKGMWMGGNTPVGYLPKDRTLVIDEPQAERIREIYCLYLEFGCVRQLKTELARRGWVTPLRKTARESAIGGRPFSRGHLYRILSNPIYNGRIAHKEDVFPGQHPAIIDEELWQAVQDRLAGNLKGHRRRSSAADPSLLAGLLIDDQGNRLIPTHAKKGAKRYRYYVSQSLLEGGRETDPKALRWPAQKLEEAVLGALVRLLKDESELLELMTTEDASETRNRFRSSKDLASRLCVANSGDRIEILARLIERITVHPQRLEIALRTASLWQSDTAKPGGEHLILIDVPVELKRCGRSVRLIVRAPGVVAALEPDAKLIALVAKAHTWFDRLCSGQCDDVSVIAQEENVTGSYVTRVVYVSYLAPDIVERILRGDHPMELNAKRLMQLLPLPTHWEDQRSLLGRST